MTAYKTYLAAVERLRDASPDANWLDYKGNDTSLPLKATIYDAEHDREPATVEWLTECGLIHNGVFRIICNGGPVGAQRTLAICGVGFVKLNPTRGQVLLLLSVFGEGGK